MPSKPSPEMATAGTASEAEEAFTWVIRPDQPASMTGEAADLPPEETDHGEATAEQGHATPVAEVPVAIDAPSLVPSIESPAHPDAKPDPDEIENFAARRKEARRSSRWTALILVQCRAGRRSQRGRTIFPTDGFALCCFRAAGQFA
jgi:hypothetical protein